MDQGVTKTRVRSEREVELTNDEHAQSTERRSLSTLVHHLAYVINAIPNICPSSVPRASGRNYDREAIESEFSDRTR